MEKLILLVLLPLFLGQVFCQEKFIVAVSEYAGGRLPVYRCPATIITASHVVTTAACARVSTALGVTIQWTYTTPSGGVGSSSSTSSTEHVFIHPNYTASQPNFNNIAVVMISGTFNTTAFPAQALGSLKSNSTCSLYGWGGAPEEPFSMTLRIDSPSQCNSSLPQVFCSINVNGVDPCLPHSPARAGSPVLCNQGSFDGILLSSGCTIDSQNRVITSYHSIGDFKDWIELVSGAESVKKLSSVIVLSAIVVGLKSFL